jgi:hypothetical protein
MARFAADRPLATIAGVRGAWPSKGWRTAVATVVVGAVCFVVGLAFLSHPIVGWPYGAAHKSDLPPMWGIGLLAVPVVLLGIAVWKLWDRWAAEVQVRLSRRSGCRRR